MRSTTRNDLTLLQGIAEMISLRANLLRIWLDLEDALGSMSRNFDHFHRQIRQGFGPPGGVPILNGATTLIPQLSELWERYQNEDLTKLDVLMNDLQAQALSPVPEATKDRVTVSNEQMTALLEIGKDVHPLIVGVSVKDLHDRCDKFLTALRRLTAYHDRSIRIEVDALCSLTERLHEDFRRQAVTIPDGE